MENRVYNGDSSKFKFTGKGEMKKKYEFWGEVL